MEESSEQERNSAFTFEQKNSDFLNKEITFFVDNLRKVSKSNRVQHLLESNRFRSVRGYIAASI
jgi:hypothetical protein